jgi:hypothetical protein
VQDYGVANAPNSSTVAVSNNTVLPSNAAIFLWNGSIQSPTHNIDHVDIDHARYIVVDVLSLPNNSIVELEYSSNGFSYENTVTVGSGSSAYFPVLPTSTLKILMGNTNTVNIIENPLDASSPPPIFGSVETATTKYHY